MNSPGSGKRCKISMQRPVSLEPGKWQGGAHREGGPLRLHDVERLDVCARAAHKGAVVVAVQLRKRWRLPLPRCLDPDHLPKNTCINLYHVYMTSNLTPSLREASYLYHTRILQRVCLHFSGSGMAELSGFHRPLHMLGDADEMCAGDCTFRVVASRMGTQGSGCA